MGRRKSKRQTKTQAKQSFMKFVLHLLESSSVFTLSHLVLVRSSFTVTLWTDILNPISPHRYTHGDRT